MKSDFTSRLKCGVSAIAVATTLTFGIQASYAANQEAVEDEKLIEDDMPLVEEVIVTGSRLRKNIFTSTAPLDVIMTDSAMTQGIGDVGALLQSATIASGSSQVTAASSTAFVQNGGLGTNTISLRGLGANRTLVLLNGRRAGPAGVRGGVSSFDFNVIPLAAVERIEILKDGASSIYGSDAVAGVVNLITKRGDGGSIDAFYSQPFESGGEELRINATWGQEFEKGYFRVSADYYKKSELAKGDRDYFQCGEQYIFDPDTGARADTIDPRTGKAWCNDLLWGHVWVYDYAGNSNVPARAKMQYDYDGDLAQYIPPLEAGADPNWMVAPAGWFPVAYDQTSDGVTNADHPFQDASSLIPEIERFTIMADGEYEIADNVTAYAEVLLNRRKTKSNGYRQYWSYIYNENFFAGNPLSAGWTGAQWLSPTPITDHSGSDVTVDYSRFVAGLKGEINERWNYDLSFQYSRSDGEYTEKQIYKDAVEDQNWLSGSCAGTVTSVRGVPCIDIPWLDPEFLRGNISSEMRDFLFGEETGTTLYEQYSVDGWIGGETFELPAGPVNAGFGFHYRNDEITDTPGDITRVVLPDGTEVSNAWGTSTAGVTSGSDRIYALFGEADVPLVEGKTFMEDLSLNVSGRHTNSRESGTGWTYKVGLNWTITPEIRIRANQGTSFRTPALFELYLADQTSSQRQSALDPCVRWGAALDAGDLSQRIADNCAADGLAADYAGGAISATIITGGGRGILKNETSTSKTIGAIWTPGFTDLSVSVDYFDIEIRDEVTQLGGAQIVFGCYNSEFFPDEPLCDQFERNAQLNNIIDNVKDSFINIATQRNRGLDVSALWRTETPLGDLTVSTQHTFQFEDVVALFEDTSKDSNGFMGDPKWTGRLDMTLNHEDWSFFWGVQFIGAASNEENFGGDLITTRGREVRIVLKTDMVTYHNASVSRTFEDQGITALVGISNIFGKAPPRLTTLNLGEVSTEGNSAFYSQYNWTGRQIFFNLKKIF